MSTFEIAMIVFGAVMIAEGWSSAYAERRASSDERLERLEKKIDALALKLTKEEDEL